MGMVRFALAMAVVLSHLPLASYKFLSGGLAVQCFFVISGFYMALVLDGKYKNVGVFYSNRLLRLFPTYFVMLGATAIAVFVFRASATATPELFATIFQDPLTGAVMIFENLTMLGQEMLFWLTIDSEGAMAWDIAGPLPSETTTVAWQGLLVPQAWSISMELMFYALAPWLMRAGYGWIAAIAVLSIAFRLAGHLTDVDYLLWQGRLFPTALFLFLFGMLAYRLLPLAARLPKAIGYVLALVVLAAIVTYPLMQLPPLTARWIFYALVALTTPFIFNAFQSSALDRWVGDLSYPIYMSQLLVIGAVLVYEPPFGMWVAILGTLAVSVAILVLIDRPIDRWRQRRAGSREPAAAPGAASVAPL